MPKFRVRSTYSKSEPEIDFETLRSLISGTSILYLKKGHDETLYFGLSEGLHLGVAWKDDGTMLLSVGRPDSQAPVRLQLLAPHQRSSAKVIEGRIRSIRQVYAMVVMLEQGQSERLGQLVLKDPSLDLETLLDPNDCLVIEAAGRGSFFVTFATAIGRGIASAPGMALTTLSLVYGESRQLLIQRLRAKTELVVAEASVKAAEARKLHEEAEQLRDKRLLDLAAAIGKIKDPQAQAALRKRFALELQAVNPELVGPGSVKLLISPGGTP